MRGRCSTSTNLLPVPIQRLRSSSVFVAVRRTVRLTSCPESDCADADADVVVSRTLTAPRQSYRSAWYRTPRPAQTLAVHLRALPSEIPPPARARCRHPLREQLLLASRNCSQCPSSPRAAAAIQFPVRRAAFRVRAEALIASHRGGAAGRRAALCRRRTICVFVHCPLVGTHPYESECRHCETQGFVSKLLNGVQTQLELQVPTYFTRCRTAQSRVEMLNKHERGYHAQIYVSKSRPAPVSMSL